MRNTFLFIVLALCSFGISAQNSVLKTVPEKPEVGKKVTITYTGKLAKEGTTLKIIPHNMLNSKAANFPVVIDENKITLEYAIPDTATYVMLIFQNGKDADRSTAFNLYKKGKPVAGTYLSEAIVKMNKTFNNDDFNQGIVLLEKEFKLNPKLKTNI